MADGIPRDVPQLALYVNDRIFAAWPLPLVQEKLQVEEGED